MADEVGVRSSQGGFTMVAVLVALAVLSIMMGVAVQTVTFQMRREKEAELIFRGRQYVEAIRLYRQKYGRFPNSLKEIWDAKPRVIRKMWKDPITDSWYWGLIHPGQGGRRIGGGRGAGGGFGPPATPTPTVTPTPFPTPPPGTPPDELPMEIGPIIGVYSRSCEKSIKIYEGHSTYCEWKFVLKVQAQTPTAGGVRPPSGRRPPGSVPPTGGSTPGGRRPPTGGKPF